MFESRTGCIVVVFFKEYQVVVSWFFLRALPLVEIMRLFEERTNPTMAGERGLL